MSEVTQMISKIIQAEGGYVDHPHDKGGPTKWGITQKTLSLWRGKNMTKADVQALTKFDAISIYYFKYYVKPGINELAQPIQPIMLDMSINHGHVNAIKMLQRTLNRFGYLPDTGIDGLIGFNTLKAVREALLELADIFIFALVDTRIAFYKAIINQDPSQKVFEKGWLARAESFRPTKTA